MQSAEQTSTLKDLGPELGIGNSRRYISDGVVRWKLILYLQGSHCIDEILSFREDTMTHRWECTKDGCLLPCVGYHCEKFALSVLSETDLEKSNDAETNNCGDRIEIYLPEVDEKVLDFTVFGISELTIISHNQGRINGLKIKFYLTIWHNFIITRLHL